MDGFLQARRDSLGMRRRRATRTACPARALPDVMGYKTAHDIPNYWAYASNFVLQDHMFEPVAFVEPARPPLPRLGLVGAAAAATRTR